MVSLTGNPLRTAAQRGATAKQERYDTAVPLQLVGGEWKPVSQLKSQVGTSTHTESRGVENSPICNPELGQYRTTPALGGLNSAWFGYHFASTFLSRNSVRFTSGFGRYQSI